MKIIIFLFISICCLKNVKAQSNSSDSVKQAINFYDSISLAIKKIDLTTKIILGGIDSNISYKGLIYIDDSLEKIVKIELWFSNDVEKRILLLHKKRIIMVSINDKSHFIVSNKCFTEDGVLEFFCSKISSTVL